jgi:DNA-binding SARP family transcriptional activator/tetratricopeptide (TPR) repeat protein
MVELRLLGPVALTAAGRPVELGAPKQRAVLAALAVDLGRPVPVSALVGRVWDEPPPVGARAVLYTHLSAIRLTLRRVAAIEQPAPVLVRRGGGYALEVEPDRVDLHRFHRLVELARRPDLPPAEQLLVTRQALDLWHGPALADLPSTWAGQVRDGCAQQRLAVARQWAEAALAVGQPAAVVEEMLALTGQHPLMEPLLALLMRALHADGRDAEALDQYGAGRRRLVEELGIDPGTEVRDVHTAILRGTITRPVQPRPAAPGRPAQLPADVDHFTGRGRELSELDELLAAGGQSTAVVISAISGTAGVGKTALALRWAHRARAAYGDGQLYVNLRGYDPERPVPAGDALAGFLRALGVAGHDIPLEVDERAARYRTLLDGRRLLIVLDNASSAEQVRPLLPGTASCAVLITSRDSLAGLVARNGVRRIDLDLLPADDAVALLHGLIGARVPAEPAATLALAEQCVRLPLALRVAAELAAARPAAALAQLVEELADHRRRLDRLDAGGDPRTAVRAVFSWSYQHLPADAAGAFRRLGLHPGRDVDSYATAALTGGRPEAAGRILDTLAAAHLVQPAGAGRYAMHDLLRAYAAGLAQAEDSADARAAALTGLVDYYRATASAAADALYPAERHRRPQLEPAGCAIPPLADPAAALAWLDAERPTLVAVGAHATAHGRPTHAVHLAAILFRYLDSGGHYPDALAVHGHARAAAGQLGDRGAEAHALTNLGGMYWRQGHNRQATDHFEAAVVGFAAVGDPAGQARALGNLGNVYARLGHYDQAADHYRQALDRHRRAGDRLGAARALTNLGNVDELRSRYEPAADHHQQALRLYRDLGDREGEANGLDNLGKVYQGQGRYDEAADHHQQALRSYRETGNRTGQANALDNIGEVRRRQGRFQQAAADLQLALALYQELGDRAGEAITLDSLGETLHAIGEHGQARARHTAALALAVETGNRYEQARAHNGLARSHHAGGELAAARAQWQQALALYTDLGVPDADAVRQQLAAAEQLTGEPQDIG